MYASSAAGLDHAQQHSADSAHEAARAAHLRSLQVKLAGQARMINKLSRELLQAYGSGAADLSDISKRDPVVKAELDRRQKKIWWLESELRKTREKQNAHQDHAITVNVAYVKRRARRVVGSIKRRTLRTAGGSIRALREKGLS